MQIPRPPAQQRVWWVVGTVGVLAGIVMATWFGLSASRGLSWTDTGHHVLDDQRIQLRFDVVDHDKKPVRCTVKAYAPDHSVVGRRSVELAASGFESTRHVVEIRTTQRATAATVEDCEQLP